MSGDDNDNDQDNDNDDDDDGNDDEDEHERNRYRVRQLQSATAHTLSVRDHSIVSYDYTSDEASDSEWTIAWTRLAQASTRETQPPPDTQFQERLAQSDTERQTQSDTRRQSQQRLTVLHASACALSDSVALVFVRSVAQSSLKHLR